MKKVLWISVCFLLAFVFSTAKVIGRTEKVQNDVCPVMGGKVDAKIFTEYDGKKVYFCCAGCPSVFRKNPEKYVGKLPQSAKDDELGKLRAELRVVLKKIAEQQKLLYGEAAGREMCKLFKEEMKRVSEETGIGMADCGPMHGKMTEKGKGS